MTNRQNTSREAGPALSDRERGLGSSTGGSVPEQAEYEGYAGDILGRWTVREFTLTESVYTCGSCAPRHAHGPATFGFVFQGGFTEICENHSFEFKPLTFVFRPPGAVHEDRVCSSGGRCYNFEIGTKFLERLREYSLISDRPTSLRNGVVAGLAIKLYREFQQLDQVSPLTIEGLTLELLGEASRMNTSRVSCNNQPRWLKAARDLIHAHYTEDLTLTRIATTLQVDPAHLSRMFKRFYRRTLGEYVREKRIELACDRLIKSDAPISQISLESGFCDQSHLCNVFKHFVGLTPAKFRAVCSRKSRPDRGSLTRDSL